ncbi:MAG: hypothetical protein Q4G45_02895, partial [Actinomycetia bacterium]|nr:hypothetical protein [Actinomycetes bacterium]
MSESLERVREPVAAVALLVLLGKAVGGLVAGSPLVGLAEAVLLCGLVLLCAGLAPRSRYGSALAAAAGLFLVTAAAEQTVVAVLISQPVDSLLSQLAEQALLGLLATLLLAVARTPEKAPQQVPEPEPAAVEAPAEPEPEPAPDPLRQPVWEASAASGAIWRRASDAAAGAQAAAYGTAGDGWSQTS